MMRKLAVHLENVSVYYGQTPAVSNVCLEIAEGEYLGIIGPNGGGKSTLLKAILGLVPVTSGMIEIFGHNLKDSKKHIGYVPQFAQIERNFPISLIDVVITGRPNPGIHPFSHHSKNDMQIVETLLEKVGLSELANRQVSELSGGEFQKMLIARALAVQPQLLILDEPTASVDAVSRSQIFNLLAELSKTITIILVTHDLMAVSSQVHRLACMNTELVYHGEPELSNDIVNHLYGCPVDLIAHGVPHRVLQEHQEGKNDRFNHAL